MELTIRELKHNDIDILIKYWHSLSDSKLLKFGADKTKFPKRNVWQQKLKDEIDKNVKQKQFYYLLWLVDDIPVGHSNIDKIIIGESAFMHLHLWKQNIKHRNLGFQFSLITIPLYFKIFELENLYCEPNSNNIAPNRVLEKLGFEFIKQSRKTPNWITFHQKVNEYILNRNKIAFNLKL